MQETARICQQMKQMVYGEAWHGPTLCEVLDGVTAEIAAAKPISGFHSIWELLGHLTVIQEMMCERIAVGADSQDQWPATPEPTEAAWQQAIDRFKSAEDRLRQAVAALSDDRLPLLWRPGASSMYNNLHGNIQHTAYHIAQIGLLKKLVLDPSAVHNK